MWGGLYFTDSYNKYRWRAILGEKLTDGYSFMPLVFYLQRSYSFNCDRFSELQSRIVKDIAWLCCLIFLRFNFATAVKDSVWLLLITIPRYVVGSWGYRYNANSSCIHTILKSFMVFRFPALICTSSSSIFERTNGSPLLYNFFHGTHLNHKNTNWATNCLCYVHCAEMFIIS